MSLAASPAPGRRWPKSPRGGAQLVSSADNDTGGPRRVTPYAPPRQRLRECLDECERLDRELQVIEHSGHARLGVFAKPLGEQLRVRRAARAAAQNAAQHLPEDPVANPAAAGVDDDATDDLTRDPFFHGFYDDSGRSLYEQLLRARMRALALARMLHTRESAGYARAAVELAETYARMHLWKQAHTHATAAQGILQALDAARQAAQEDAKDDDVDDDAQAERDCGRLLAFLYQRQLDRDGTVMRPELREWATTAAAPPLGSVFAAILAPSNLDALFGAAPFLHWQQLLLRLERQSAVFQDFVRGAEARAARDEAKLPVLRQAFAQLDPSRFGVVPLHSLTELLEAARVDLDDDSDRDGLAPVCAALRAHAARVQYPSLTWSELLQLAGQSRAFSPHAPDANDSARELRPRVQFLLGRFALRRGLLEDATRLLQLAIAEHERVHGAESGALVPLYLALAEARSVRFKQLAVVAQQRAREVAAAWLATTDGSRRLRGKALEVIERKAAQHPAAALPSKKDAEAQARAELLQEYAALSFVRPDATAIEDAVEHCTKAWRLLEAKVGADHVSTASVHVALAQVHAAREDVDESVRCYERAVAIFEAACRGPVPASVWLSLAIAKLLLPVPGRAPEAAERLEAAGDFFHSFALEFASSDATRRESCAQAIDAWRQWLVLAGSNGVPCTLEEQRRVRAKIHDATVDGFGEFAVEAAESGRELAQLLVTMGQLRQGERHLRAAWYVLESHFGANDRRSRKARKELVALGSEIKGAALDHDHDDGGHEWLTI